MRTIAEIAAAVGFSEDYIHKMRHVGRIQGFQRSSGSGRPFVVAEPDFQRIVQELAPAGAI